MQFELAPALFSLVILIMSIIVHEVAHGYAADALGDPTAKLQGRLTLNPLPHIDPIGSVLIPAFLVLTGSNLMFGWAKPVPYNPYNLRNQRWGEAIVAFAGVATNLTLAIIFVVITRMAAGAGMMELASAAATIAFINLFLGLFNLIPIPPIDGFAVLRSILPYKYAIGFRRFEAQMQQGGLITLVLFLFVFSYFFAAPFARFVHGVFGVLIGV